MTVDFKELDRRVWDEELDGFVPPRIFDAHVHLFNRSCLRPGVRFSEKSIYGKVGGEFAWEQHRDWIRAHLPGRAVSMAHFGHPCFDSDLEASAAYSGAISDRVTRFGMALVAPRDSGETVRHRVMANRLVGYKPYLEFVEGKPKPEITIQDMLPEPQMRAADELGLAITLHIPRPERLADPVNQKQMVEICRRYPRARLIFAHIGRAYYLSNVIGFLDGIAACPNAYVDTAMVNHEGVLEYTFRNFPLDRILFGSDAPVAWLRGKSVEINNQYAYLMGEDYEIGTSIYDSRHAVAFTTFYYEQLRGIKLAAGRAGLSRAEIEGIFFNNAHRLFTAVAQANYGKCE